jgi:hypothetical protein
MPPQQFNNFAKALRSIMSKYNFGPRPQMRKLRFTLSPKTLSINPRLAAVVNPFNNMIKGIRSTLSNVLNIQEHEDYDSIVGRFLPANADLIKPQMPVNSRTIQLANLDGDPGRALISTYKLKNEIKTLVLKKQNNEWYKAAEISNLDHDTLNYRGVADVKGEGNKQLLLGLTSDKTAPMLYGYSFENNGTKELFRRKYSRFEVLNPHGNNSNAEKSEIAFWDKKDEDSYNIEVHHWNGLQLEQHENSAHYYVNRVVPHYASKIKQNPNILSNWYNLADTLSKAGMKRDALTAVRVGMKVDKNSELKDKFLALKDEISRK